MAVPRLVARRLTALRDRVARDDVLRGEVADFLALADDAWSEEAPDIAATVGDRRCRVTPDQIELSHALWTGSKRIPL